MVTCDGSTSGDYKYSDRKRTKSVLSSTLRAEVIDRNGWEIEDFISAE
jgi:hypothetical protein